MRTPDPLAGLSPHDWPRIVDAIVSAVARSETWEAYVVAIAAAGDVDLGASGSADDPRAARVDAAQAELLRQAAGFDARAHHGREFRAGLVRRLSAAARAASDGSTAARSSRNPFPLRFDAALLAGGSGTRIGGGKPFVRLGGRPLAAWSAAAVARYAERLLVVARTAQEAEAVADAVAPHVAAPVVAVVDRPGTEGPVAALLGAADAAGGLLLTAPADTPFLPDYAAFALLEGSGATCVAATDRAHPTVLLAEATRLRALAPAWSLHATLAPLAPVAVPFPEGSLFNVNTREDLAEAEARLARR